MDGNSSKCGLSFLIYAYWFFAEGKPDQILGIIVFQKQRWQLQCPALIMFV